MLGYGHVPQEGPDNIRVKVADKYNIEPAPASPTVQLPEAVAVTGIDLSFEREELQNAQSQAQNRKGPMSDPFQSRVETLSSNATGTPTERREAASIGLLVAGIRSSNEEIIKCMQTYQQFRDMGYSSEQVASALALRGYQKDAVDQIANDLMGQTK